MLPAMKLVRQLPSEDVSWQVAPSCSTQRTSGNNPTVWHGSDRGRDGLAASLAPNGEVAEPRLGQVPHRNSIGEQKGKICKGFYATPKIHSKPSIIDALPRSPIAGHP